MLFLWCIFVEFLTLLPTPAFSWRFKKLGLDEDKIQISRIAVYGVRAFLTIPRVYDAQPFTLVEVPWPERWIFPTAYSTKPFPSGQSQKIGNCSEVQSAITLDMDNNGRLFVLDRGTEGFCPPKILIFDLKVNKEILQTDLTGIPGDKLGAMVIDYIPNAKDFRIIIGDAGNNTLLVYNLFNNDWWQLSITNPTESGDDKRFEKSLNFSFNQLALSLVNNTVYATSSEQLALYSINLKELRNIETIAPLPGKSLNNAAAVSVHYVGDKFGKSKGLLVDSKGNLYYIYERDSVILKWNPSYPFETENVQVVFQDDKQILHPAQLFAEPSHQLWVLNSKPNKNYSYVVKIKN